MSKNSKAKPQNCTEETLELSGWLKHELYGIRSALKGWSVDHTSDKNLCYSIYNGLSNLDQIIGSMTDKCTRDRLRKEIAEAQDPPF